MELNTALPPKNINNNFVDDFADDLELLINILAEASLENNLAPRNNSNSNHFNNSSNKKI